MNKSVQSLEKTLKEGGVLKSENDDWLKNTQAPPRYLRAGII